MSNIAVINVEEANMKNLPKTLRLILGDQLNLNHSWFADVDENITYVLMEVRSETDYAYHHIQKVVGFFVAMRTFAEELLNHGHKVIYLKIGDSKNLQSIEENLAELIDNGKFTNFEYQLPDEFRLDKILCRFCNTLSISYSKFDTEHFFTTRDELGIFFTGKNVYVMENFYRSMRKKHNILMQGTEPLTGIWNYDHENRSKLPKNHVVISPYLCFSNVSAVYEEIKVAGIETMGKIDPNFFIWPINRRESLELLSFFVENCLPLFGTFQDTMQSGEWSLYHARISFSLNTKMIAPNEVIEKAIDEWQKNPKQISFNQLEGFVRQILGWREYMRGMYWLKMPDFSLMNFFQNKRKIPKWYWDGKTKMNCLKNVITQSLQFAYAHHIQRLMVTGNFALLAGIDPDEVDQWYLGVYIDAIEWVEITNTRGMSQFADGGIIGTKPYVSSASYINKMSNYCTGCFYDKNKKTGDKACPFNSLYWNFFDAHQEKLGKNPRLSMMYNKWLSMKHEEKESILRQASFYLKNIDTL